MLRRKFDFEKLIDVVVYLRMSSDKQNKNSPKQQLSQIKKLIKSRGLPWRIVKIYRDDAKSGLLTENRPGFRMMLNDIRNGTIEVQAILVDTIERFGRMDDLEVYRNRLLNRDGVYVLSADRQFADPHAPEAKVMNSFENLRASEAGRIKASDVFRGKIDAIELGYWPGSPVPFGYDLEVVCVEKRKGREVKHHRLVIHVINGPIMRYIFRLAAANPSCGQDRLSKFLNESDNIPQNLKPFYGSTIGKRLRSPIYRGILLWSDNCTGVVAGRRIVEKNEEEHVVRVEDFCEPITNAETLRKVDEGILIRARKGFSNGKPKRGVNYRYPLTGLVRCGHCGSSMVSNSTSPYESKDGTRKVYCSYACPRRRSGACENTQPVKEDWLRKVVFDKITERLFPSENDLREFVDLTKSMIEEEQTLRRVDEDSNIPILEAELAKLKKDVDGWKATLADPDLHRSMRQGILSDSATACDRIDEIQLKLEENESADSVLTIATSDKEISDGLQRLHEVIDGECPTAMNLELSMHVDRIDCYSDGRVVSRICKIGSTPIAVNWFSAEFSDEDMVKPDAQRGKNNRTNPRRRARLRLNANGLEEEEILRDRIRMATNPHRFRQLPDDWFWLDEFQVPKRTSWVEENAQAVLARYEEIKATGKKPSLNAMAKEFGKSRPTISRALDIATGTGGNDKPEHRREPKSVKGNPELEAKIAQMHDEGKLNKEIAQALGLGRSTVTLALDRLYKERGIPRPDGRRERHQ